MDPREAVKEQQQGVASVDVVSVDVASVDMVSVDVASVDVAEGSGGGRVTIEGVQSRENWLCGKAAGLVWAYSMEAGLEQPGTLPRSRCKYRNKGPAAPAAGRALVWGA